MSDPVLPEYVFTKLRVYPAVRPDLMALLPSGLGRVLDVGCGTGLFGEELVASGKADAVVGIDVSPDAVAQAEERLEGALVADLDLDPASMPLASFNTIIYGDVLEHCKFPWDVVRAQRPLLKAGGRAFCSIPNVGHARVVSGLARQRWEYETEGIFDYTHLRFFTRRSLESMFRSASYRVVSCRQLEPASRKARVFNAATLGVMRELTIRGWWLEAAA